MLASSKRLNLKKDFQWVRQGKVIDCPLFKLFIRIGENNEARVGIATSSKYFKKATERNKGRRLISAAFESLYNSLPSRINIIALPKQAILNVKSGDVLLELNEVLEKSKILNNENTSH